MSANAADTVVAAVENTAEKAKEVASATVETITEAVKNTSIAPKTTEPKPDTSEADAAHAASAAEGRRLYIGNLAYSTTDEQLKEFFEGFSIESTSIPTNPRTGRAVGYAFVDLTTKEEADRAIEQLSGNEVQERKVSVQLARKPGAASTGTKKQHKQQEQQEPREEGAVANEEGGEGKRGRGGVRGRGRGRGGRAKRGTRGEAGSGDETAADGSNKIQPLVESTNVKTVDASGEEAHQDGNAASAFKGKKKRGPPENGIPSSTKIMVANLPYELSEDQLKELFKDYQPESAKIALRPIPRYMVRKLQQRGEPRKGRGFGFVTLASEDMQKKAVEEMNGKVIEGREIAVKVAIDSQVSDSEDKENTTEEKTEDKKEENEVKPAAVAVAAAVPEPVVV
ncbi:hypothetical protein BZA05DRAFT_197248 [Tricharina praecox]|uniref:uncharacterized protein n=1 Tax=Tricharina praecox TaxID=43433 RepID=UPI002220D78C|nr:uncharacterized protein BZA05DRAFT_197248 [Tricharina praecox]KAI5856284.1 hypothetical protein BZA05DRAFT_197248 [Tricharina praecox]